jgi:hypothetical protein
MRNACKFFYWKTGREENTQDLDLDIDIRTILK